MFLHLFFILCTLSNGIVREVHSSSLILNEADTEDSLQNSHGLSYKAHIGMDLIIWQPNSLFLFSQPSTLSTDSDSFLEFEIYFSRVSLVKDIYEMRNKNLRQLFRIPKLKDETVTNYEFTYQVKYELSLLRKMSNSLRELLSHVSNNHFSYALSSRNQFIELAARYQLYSDYYAALTHHEECENFGQIFDALDIIKRLSPSLDFELCKRPPLEASSSETRKEDEGTPLRPSLGFLFLYEVLQTLEILNNLKPFDPTSLEEFKLTSHESQVQKIENAIGRFSQIDKYFHINEYIRVMLPFFTDISEFDSYPNLSEAGHIITKISELVSVVNKISPELRNISLKEAKTYFNTCKEDEKRIARRRFTHALLPWKLISNLGLVGYHAENVVVTLQRQQNREIIIDATQEIACEFKNLLPFLYIFIKEEIGDALGRDISSSLLDLQKIETPNLKILGNYGGDITYLNKIIQTLELLDLSAPLSTNVLLRIYEIMGESAKNLSVKIQRMTSEKFWKVAKDVRNESQKRPSFLKRLKCTFDIVSAKMIIQNELQGILNVTKELLNKFPTVWVELKTFYQSLTSLAIIEDTGSRELEKLLKPSKLSFEEEDTLLETVSTLEGSNLKEAEKIINDIKNGRITKQNFQKFTALLKRKGLEENIDQWEKMKYKSTQKNETSEVKVEKTIREEVEESCVASLDILDRLNGLDTLLKEVTLDGTKRSSYAHYRDHPEIFLAAEHNFTIIREDLKKLRRGIRHLQRDEIENEVIKLLNDYCRFINARVDHLGLSGNELVHMEEISLFSQPSMGDEAVKSVAYHRIIALLDGLPSCDCYYCSNTFSPFDISFKNELQGYATIVRHLIGHSLA